jgi:hypothetical protein
MSVNFEIKGMLARLLATEDLVVENKNVKTACFNVHTRVLTLPMWEKASNTVYDMLVAHEVSHALYSPDVIFSSFGVPHNYINVVEDARVEKLIKRRYMGLAKTFYGAYKELQGNDFFSLGDRNTKSLKLVDRVNLYFKVGNFITINFNKEEQEIVDEIAQIETFEDTVIVTRKLYDLCKRQKKISNDPQIESEETLEENSESGEFFDEDDTSEEIESEESSDEDDTSEEIESEESSDEESSDEESSDEDDTSEEIESEESSDEGGDDDDDEVETLDSLQKSIEELTNNGVDSIYVEVPSLTLNTLIANNKEIHEYIDKSFYEMLDHNDNYANNIKNTFKMYESEYKKFKISSQKEVNYLVKEFECRKAADSYSRSLVSKSGSLDCSKLHNYRFSDDIFRKVTTIQDGKNHGLIFILDWSGSMRSIMLDTIKQLYNLVWFCKKISIPFDVYAFSEEWSKVHTGKDFKLVYPKQHYIKKANIFSVDEQFNLLNFFTSNMNGKDLEHQMKNIWRIVNLIKDDRIRIPPRIRMSGTPLNDTLMALHEIIPDFQKRNDVQKVQCVILTDGESNETSYHVEIRKDFNTKPRIGNRSIFGKNIFLRDRKLGITYKIGNGKYTITDTLIYNLRDKFPNVNFIGMRIMKTYNVTTILNYYVNGDLKLHESIMNNWKKNKCFSLTQSPYSKYFGISDNSLFSDSDFIVDDNATKVQIKSAFTKSLSRKKMNKKILSEFVNMIV